MTQTKAAKVIETLLDNDLASSVYQAVVGNDYQTFLDALDEANLTVDDLTLSSTEFDNLVKGVKPSGELDIVTWEGYYEATSPQEANPFAFLILSSTKKVYWGSRTDVLGDPTNHVVSYTLTTDGKLEFTTTDDGKVSIALTREYDDSAGTVKVEFKGTRKGESISGGQAIPPLYRPKDVSTASAAKASVTAFVKAAFGAADKDESQDLDIWKVWEIIWGAISIIFNIVSWGVASFQAYLWIRDDLRERRTARLRQNLDEETPLYSRIAEKSCDPPEVNFNNAGAKVTRDIIARINQDLVDNPPDYDTSTPQEITDSLRASAEAEAERSVRSYVRSRILSDIAEALDKYKALSNYDDLAKDIEARLVSVQADPKLEELGPSTSYDSVIRPTVLEAREAYFKSNYVQTETLFDGAQQEYEAAKNKTAQIQSQIDDIDKEDEKKREEDQGRRDQLEKDLEKAKSEEKDKEKERDEAKDKKDDAGEKSDEAKEDKEKDTSKQDWDKKVGDVFK